MVEEINNDDVDDEDSVIEDEGSSQRGDSSLKDFT